MSEIRAHFPIVSLFEIILKYNIVKLKGLGEFQLLGISASWGGKDKTIQDRAGGRLTSSKNIYIYTLGCCGYPGHRCDIRSTKKKKN